MTVFLKIRMPWKRCSKTGICSARRAGVCAAVLYSLLMGACTEIDSGAQRPYLLCIGTSCADAGDFQQALSFALRAYPDEVIERSDLMRVMQMRVLRQLAEELVLLERCLELGIAVTDEDLQAAVARYQQDYPPGCFEKELQRNVVSEKDWRRHFRLRLLREKLMAQDLGRRVALDPSDIEAYIQSIDLSQSADGKRVLTADELDAAVLSELKRKKMEAAYPQWMATLWRRYPLDINAEALARLTGAPAVSFEAMWEGFF